MTWRARHCPPEGRHSFTPPHWPGEGDSHETNRHRRGAVLRLTPFFAKIGAFGHCLTGA